MTSAVLNVSPAADSPRLLASRSGFALEADVTGFYDAATGSVQYVVADPITQRCAIIDPVLDFDPKSGSTGTASADQLLRHIEARGLALEWILDTHPHADHFSAAGYLKDVVRRMPASASGSSRGSSVLSLLFMANHLGPVAYSIATHRAARRGVC